MAGRRRWPVILGVVAAVLLVVAVGGWFLIRSIILGPTHPESAVEPLRSDAVEWIWVGATDASETEVRLKTTVDPPGPALRLAVGTDPDLAEPLWFTGEQLDADVAVVTFRVADLEADTTYHYAPEIDGALDRAAAGQFQTFPTGPASFLLAFGGCARSGSNGQVFDAIDQLDPLLYGIVGDLHYADIGDDDVGRFRQALDQALTSPAQSALFRSTSMAYVWDDHDYGDNNSDATSASRPAAMAAYREYVPSYTLAGPSTPLHQAVTIGRVRVVFSDARAGRDPSGDPDDGAKSLLGDEQKAWLKRELAEAAATHELVIWVQPVPWIGSTEEGADHWAGYTTERQELADVVARDVMADGVTNLVMVSGDAHMVAIDDGTNTDYSTGGGAGFPLLHVAALDRIGSTKGGPYSHGSFSGGGQFGTVEVIDDGTTLEVVLTGRTWDGETLTEYRFEVG